MVENAKQNFVVMASNILTKYQQNGFNEQILPRNFSSCPYMTKNNKKYLQEALTDPIYSMLDRTGKKMRVVLCYIIGLNF